MTPWHPDATTLAQQHCCRPLHHLNDSQFSTPSPSQPTVASTAIAIDTATTMADHHRFNKQVASYSKDWSHLSQLAESVNTGTGQGAAAGATGGLSVQELRIEIVEEFQRELAEAQLLRLVKLQEAAAAEMASVSTGLTFSVNPCMDQPSTHPSTVPTAMLTLPSSEFGCICYCVPDVHADCSSFQVAARARGHVGTRESEAGGGRSEAQRLAAEAKVGLAKL